MFPQTLNVYAAQIIAWNALLLAHLAVIVADAKLVMSNQLIQTNAWNARKDVLTAVH